MTSRLLPFPCECKEENRAVNSTSVLDTKVCNTARLPLADDLSVLLGNPLLPLPLRAVSRVKYIYEKVVRRWPEFFQPSPKNPKYVLYVMHEELACGHIIKVPPVPTEMYNARRRSCHECSGWFGGLNLTEIKRPVSKALHGAALRTKRTGTEGAGYYWPLFFALASTCILVAAYFALIPTFHVYSAPETYVRVLKQFSPYRFQLQLVNEGVPQQPTVWEFCPDYKPLFEAGFTLTRLAFEDKGNCAEIGVIDRAYVIQRQPDGWPVIPSNCVNSADKPPICSGEPRF